MQRTYQIAGTVLFLFSVFIAVESLGLKFYTSLGPGPGFFPFWLAILMGTLSAVMIYHATFSQNAPMPVDFFPSRRGTLRALAVIASLIWYVVFLEKIGFRITMMAFLVWLLYTLGRTRWYLVAGISLLVSLGGYWLFDNMLKVPLPVGPLDDVFDVATWLPFVAK